MVVDVVTSMVNCKCKVKTRNNVTQCERSSMVILAYDYTYTYTTTNYSFLCWMSGAGTGRCDARHPIFLTILCLFIVLLLLQHCQLVELVFLL